MAALRRNNSPSLDAEIDNGKEAVMCCLRYSCLILFLAVTPLHAQVTLPKSYRVKNSEPGVCCWCCLEMQGKFLGIKSLDGIAQGRVKQAEEGYYYRGFFIPFADQGGSIERVHVELAKRGITYKFERDGNRNT